MDVNNKKSYKYRLVYNHCYDLALNKTLLFSTVEKAIEYAKNSTIPVEIFEPVDDDCLIYDFNKPIWTNAK